MGKVETVVFLSLVLDLFGASILSALSTHSQRLPLAFTIPLPLFPRLIEWYTVVSNVQSCRGIIGIDILA